MTVLRRQDFFKGIQTTDGNDEISKKESHERVKPHTVFIPTVTN